MEKNRAIIRKVSRGLIRNDICMKKSMMRKGRWENET